MSEFLVNFVITILDLRVSIWAFQNIFTSDSIFSFQFFPRCLVRFNIFLLKKPIYFSNMSLISICIAYAFLMIF